MLTLNFSYTQEESRLPEINEASQYTKRIKQFSPNPESHAYTHKTYAQF